MKKYILLTFISFLTLSAFAQKITLGSCETKDGGVYQGEMVAGKPHGKGTMTFIKSHSIDGCQEQALPGDYIIGYCEDGILTNGALYRDGEKIESFIR